MKKLVKVVQMKTSEFVEKYNSELKNDEKKINRHDVYNMIKDGKLKAHKGFKGAWIIDVEIYEEVKKKSKKKSNKKAKEYSVKEYVEAYNKKFPNCVITVPEVRKLIADGKLKAEKVNRKWVIKSSPSKRIK